MANSDEEAIRKVLGALENAWNRHDADAFSVTFADDADFTNVLGMQAHGRAQIREFHATIFATRFKDSKLTLRDMRVRFLKPDVAAVDVWWGMTGDRDPNGNPSPDRQGLANLIFTNDDGNWRIKVMHNMDLPNAQ